MVELRMLLAGPGPPPAHGLDRCGRSKWLAGGMVGREDVPEDGHPSVIPLWVDTGDRWTSG